MNETRHSNSLPAAFVAAAGQWSVPGSSACVRCVGFGAMMRFMHMLLACSPDVPAVRVERLRCRLGSERTLVVPRLRVAAGEIVAIMGLNGAGKSTLLRCILDLWAIQSGDIELFGIPHRNPLSRARSAFLPERFMPLYYLRGRDLLSYVLALHGQRYVETEARAMCSEFDLDPGALERPVRDLSKGMAQKLGLAACLLSRRPLLLLDEPASGLDARGRRALSTRLCRHRESGGSVLFTSHHAADVETLANRLLVVHAGQTPFFGSGAELRARFHGESLEASFLSCIDRMTERECRP